MLIIILIILAGIGIGCLVRGKRDTAVVQHAITLQIWVLLFMLGIEVGGNPRIIKGICSIGGEALVLALAATTGSVIAAWLFWKFAIKERQK